MESRDELRSKISALEAEVESLKKEKEPEKKDAPVKNRMVKTDEDQEVKKK